MIRYNFDRARDYIYTNGRLLERLLFAALYEGAPTQPVKDALRAYQNPDGGFGHALESDLRTPASQPLAVERAFVALDMIDGFDDPMVLKACDWLETIASPEGGLPFALPTLEGYPHTPWMDASGPAAAINPTAGLCGLLLKHGVEHPWVKRAAAYCRQAIPALESDFFHDLMAAITFLQHDSANRAQASAQLERIRTRIARPGVVALDPAAEGYVQYPLDWAPRPDSFLRPLFDNATIRIHLEALAGKQQADGGWPINWTALGPGPEAEWRAVVTIEALEKLKAYGQPGN